MITRLSNETPQFIAGPAGPLEAMLGVPVNQRDGQWAIICHPHPLHGGTMYNKVVTTLVKTYHTLGISTVRFNFRGVGQSAGVYDHGVGEGHDLLAVMDWLQSEHGIAAETCHLAGFSFGAYIAAVLATQRPLKQLVLIAPPVVNCPMDALPPILCPWVLVQGEQDEVVSAAAVLSWARTRDPAPVILTLPGASHFFHGQLGVLQERLLAVVVA